MYPARDWPRGISCALSRSAADPFAKRLNRLEAEGVVTLTRNKGAYIRALTRSDADDALAIVEVVIGLAARLAAEHIDAPGSRTLLESFLARLSGNPTRSDSVAFVRARNGF
jgi:DNA-binding GntR family transcriptional regulator